MHNRNVTLFASILSCILYLAESRCLVAGESFSGVHILGPKKLTNFVLSGTVPISFDARNEVGTLRYAMLRIDGRPCPGDGSTLSVPTFSRDGKLIAAPLKSPAKFQMDTCFLENGQHTLQIQSAWMNLTLTNLDLREFRRESDVITITVSNEIYYPEWQPEVGEGVSAYFFKTTHTNVGWHLDIYDVRKKFVQRLSGHTMDGRIEAYWHMKDAKGVLRTNADFDPEFSSILTVDSPSKKTTIRKK